MQKKYEYYNKLKIRTMKKQKMMNINRTELKQSHKVQNLHYIFAGVYGYEDLETAALRHKQVQPVVRHTAISILK